jgi:hypothetical protein
MPLSTSQAAPRDCIVSSSKLNRPVRFARSDQLIFSNTVVSDNLFGRSTAAPITTIPISTIAKTQNIEVSIESTTVANEVLEPPELVPVQSVQ